MVRSDLPKLRFNLNRGSRGVMTVEIKPMKNSSRASDHDSTADVTCIFITHAMWRYLGGRSAIQRLRLNGNDSQ